MKTYLDHEKNEVRIEVVPLVDVVFCILVFFILGSIGLSRPEGIDMDLPEATTGQPQLSNTLPVTLDLLGQVYVKEQPVTRQQLIQELQKYLKENRQGVVVLNADKLVSYDQVVQLLDLLQRIGGNRVALGTTTPQTTAPDVLDPGNLPNQNPNVPPPAGTVPPLPPGGQVPGQAPGVPNVAPGSVFQQPPGQVPPPAGGTVSPTPPIRPTPGPRTPPQP